MFVTHIRRSAVAAVLCLAATAAFASGGAMSLIPADAVSVGVVRVADLRSSPLSSTLFEHADRFGSDGEAEKFLNDAGLDLAKDIDVLVVATAPKTRLRSEGEVIVLADGRFSVGRLTGALLARGAVKKSSAHGAYYTLPDAAEEQRAGAVAFPSSTLAIAGSETAVIKALQARAAGGGSFAQSGLGFDMGRIDAGASAWALVDVVRAARLTGGTGRLHRGDSDQPLAAAIRSISTVGMWATDTGDALKLGAFGLAGDTETLQLVEDTLRGALSALRLSVREKSPEMVSVLRRFDVRRTRDAVRISGTIPGDSLRKLMAEKRARK